MYIQYMREVFLPPIQNVVGICKQITILTLYQVSSKLVTLLNSFIHVCKSGMFRFLLCFKLINFVFQIFPLFVLEMPASFTPYISDTKM
jgi:hypothetical protein